MYIVPSEYDMKNIYILPSKSNYILKHSLYRKILYSNKYITLNGIYIDVKLDKLQYFKKYNKYFLRFTNTLEDIITLEKEILSKISLKKNHNTILKTTIETKRFIIDSKYTISSNHFILYISGLWENSYEVGLIYKLIPINHPLPKNND